MTMMMMMILLRYYGHILQCKNKADIEMLNWYVIGFRRLIKWP